MTAVPKRRKIVVEGNKDIGGEEGKNDKEVQADETDEANLNISSVLNDIRMDETLTGSGTDDFEKMSDTKGDNNNEAVKDDHGLEGNDKKENTKDKQQKIGGNQGGKEDEDNKKTKLNEKRKVKKVYRSRKKVTRTSGRKKSVKCVQDSDCEILPEEYRNLAMSKDWEPKISDIDWPAFSLVLKDYKKFEKFPERLKFKEFEGKPSDIKPEDSLFYTPKGPIDIPLPKKPGPGCSYKNRKLLSAEVATVLDQWSKDWASRKLSSEMYCFEHKVEDHLCCTVQHLRDVFLSGTNISSEFIDVVLKILQIDTPVPAEWFFVPSIVGTNIQHMQLFDIVRHVPYLFMEHIRDYRWIFFPICFRNHWSLYAVDIHENKIKYYNSLLSIDKRDNIVASLSDTFFWIRSFMAWRLEDDIWEDLSPKIEECPQQSGSGNDCGIFMLRYIYCLITKQHFFFNQDDISKERLSLVYRLLTHPDNKCNWSASTSN